MKRDAFRRELERAYPPMPEATHQAFSAAVHRLEEEPVMKRKLTWIPVLIAVLVLLCGTALALLNHFSVLDYNSHVDPGIPMAENVTTINQPYENDHVEIYFGDALFDGQYFNIAFTLTPKHPEERVLLFPTLTATCDGQPLDAYMYASVGGIDQGILYPSGGGPDMIWHDYGIEAIATHASDINYHAYDFGEKPEAPAASTQSAPVTWTLKLMTLTPNLPIFFENDPALVDDPAYSMHASDRMETAYENGFILATNGNDVMTYGYAVPMPEGYDEAAWDLLGYHERLIESGVFTLADTVDCVFDTPIPDSTRKDIAAGAQFPMDGYTVEVGGIYSSFMSLGYLLRVDFPSGTITDALLAEVAQSGCYEAFTENGTSAIDFLNYGCFVTEHDDGSITLNLQADGYPQGDLSGSLTLMPFTRSSYDSDPVYHEEASFTVSLE